MMRRSRLWRVEFGAETPFLRPAEHAQDNTTDLPVFDHALKWLAEHEGYKPEMRRPIASDLAHPSARTGGQGR